MSIDYTSRETPLFITIIRSASQLIAQNYLTRIVQRQTIEKRHKPGPDDPSVPPDDLKAKIDVDGRADVGSSTRVGRNSKSGL
jgi:hypothetical protein